MQDAVAQAAAAADADAAGQCLLPLFEDIGWLQLIAADWRALMRADPATSPGLPVVRNGPMLTVTLAAAPPVRLVINLIEGLPERTDIAPESVPGISFSGMRGLYRPLSPEPVEALFGEAEPDAEQCRTRAIAFTPGQWLCLDERRQSLRIDPQARPVLMLHARIERSPPPPVRRYALDDGRLLGTVQGDDGFARSTMLMSMLRAAGAREAVPALISLLDRAAGRERWSVMRELIALDPAQAWPHLERMAAHDPDDGVRQAAQAVVTRHNLAREAA